MPIPDWLEKWIEKLDDPVEEPFEVRVDIGDISAEDIEFYGNSHVDREEWNDYEG